ncbi:hypothetical protein C8J57DRAFT_1504661 [Mycena rebaudengoi]|nr:hypothetical protein C8J57DRAFT_1504661 [Mycena rebaudengoi]
MSPPTGNAHHLIGFIPVVAPRTEPPIISSSSPIDAKKTPHHSESESESLLQEQLQRAFRKLQSATRLTIEHATLLIGDESSRARGVILPIATVIYADVPEEKPLASIF